ncbi:MAG: hypothetical protein AB8B65_07860 [Kordia sp.]|uniref:hypothetical protein n=1 Tax=Kordia sp. TaxID=1965332 RepID=UPI00385D7595
MKKNIAIIILFILIPLQSFSQDVILSKKEKRATNKGIKKIKPQETSLCDFYKIIYNNYYNDFIDITGEKKDEDRFGEQWEANIAIPAVFTDYTINTTHHVFRLEVYEGFDLKKANTALENLYNDWYACRFNSGKEFRFIKQENHLKKERHNLKKRIFYLTTTTDNLLIKFNLSGGYKYNERETSIEDVYTVSLSFIRLNDKQKVITKIIDQ